MNEPACDASLRQGSSQGGCGFRAEGLTWLPDVTIYFEWLNR